MEISVIIPTYNRCAFLKEALLSVFNQTFKDYEVIVYDDGSTDETDRMLHTFKRFYPVKYILSPINKGPAYSRNKAVEASRGNFIAFLDSDDLWLKNKLKIQYTFMREKKVRICQTDEIWLRNGKKINPMKKHQKFSGDIFERSLDLCLVSPSAVMFEKSLFEEHGGFDENLIACEDYDLWLRISIKEHIYLIAKKLVIKRGGHSDQLSHIIPYLDRFRIYSMKKLLQHNHVRGEKAKIVKNKLIQKCHIMVNGLKKKEKHEEAQYYERLLEELRN